MLLDKGITIKNADAYWKYLFLRDTLVHLERQPQVWTSGLFGIPSTADWETYKAAYIERELDQIQKRLEKGHSAHYFDLDEVLKEYRLLEKDDVPPKVFRSLQGFPKEIPSVEFKTKRHIIVMPQTIKALRDAYDKKYNERYTITSGSVSYTLNNGVTFKYNVPLPMSEIDAKYPRGEWLQMLLDKGITIDNFEEYWAYLSKRDELVELEKHPEVWSSRLFGISPTDDWETYKAAYLEQMFEKLHHNKKNAVYFGKVDAEKALKQSQALIEQLGLDTEEVLKLVEQLERSKPSLRDR